MTSASFPTPGAIRATVAPTIAEFFAVQGHDLLVIREAGVVDTSGYDRAGDAAPVAVRGFIYQLGDRARATAASIAVAAGGGTPVPVWRAILPYSAPVLEPGFRIEYAIDPARPNTRDRFYPLGAARDPGNYRLAWIVDLGSPGQRG